MDVANFITWSVRTDDFSKPVKHYLTKEQFYSFNKVLASCSKKVRARTLVDLLFTKLQISEHVHNAVYGFMPIDRIPNDSDHHNPIDLDCNESVAIL